MRRRALRVDPCETCDVVGPNYFKDKVGSAGCGKCSEPIANKVFTTKFVATKCKIDTDTFLVPCAAPNATHWVKTPCKPGTATKAGTDTVLQACDAPAWDEYVTVPCFRGSTQECGPEFPVTSSWWLNTRCVAQELQVFAQQASGASVHGHCEMHHPGITKDFTSAKCKPGDIDQWGPCRCAQVLGSYSHAIHVKHLQTGNATVTGANTVITNCLSPKILDIWKARAW